MSQIPSPVLDFQTTPSRNLSHTMGRASGDRHHFVIRAIVLHLGPVLPPRRPRSVTQLCFNSV